MNPFNIKDVSIYGNLYTTVTCEHQPSGIAVKINKDRDKASISDMRAEALNEVEYLVINSPRYARILKDQERDKQ